MKDHIQQDLDIEGNLLEYVLEKALCGYNIEHSKRLEKTFIEHDFIIGSTEKPVAVIFVTMYHALPASQFKFLRNLEELFEIKVNYPYTKCINIISSRSWVSSHKKLMKNLFDEQIILCEDVDIYNLLLEICNRTKGKKNKKRICDEVLKENQEIFQNLKKELESRIKSKIKEPHKLICQEIHRIENLRKNEMKESKKHKKISEDLKRVICKLLIAENYLATIFDINNRLKKSEYISVYDTSNGYDTYKALYEQGILDFKFLENKIQMKLKSQLGTVLKNHPEETITYLVKTTSQRLEGDKYLRQTVEELKNPIKNFEPFVEEIICNKNKLNIPKRLHDNQNLLQKLIWVIDFYLQKKSDSSIRFSQHELSKDVNISREKIRKFIFGEISNQKERDSIIKAISPAIQKRIDTVAELMNKKDLMEVTKFCIDICYAYQIYNNSKIQPLCDLFNYTLEKMNNSKNEKNRKFRSCIKKIEGFPYQQDGIKLTEEEFVIYSSFPTKANLKITLNDGGCIVVYASSASSSTHKHKEHAAIARFINKHKKIKACIHLLTGTFWITIGEYEFEVLDMLKEAGWDYILFSYEIEKNLPGILLDLVENK